MHRRLRHPLAAAGSLLIILAPPGANATYSIAACVQETGRCGVAIATNNLAVGHGAPFSEARVGAGVSQFETNPCQPPAALRSLREGNGAQAAVAAALVASAACPDGYTREQRQTLIVAVDGTTAAHTGDQAGPYAGARLGDGVVAAGNGLAGEQVIDAMWLTFHASQDPLAERLLRALEAGYAAGGQRTGVLSAALHVSTPEGWPVDVDLRVDFAPGEAVAQLREAYDANRARTVLFRAQTTKDEDRAQAMITQALALAPRWDRICLGAAGQARARGFTALERRGACCLRALNPTWAEHSGIVTEELDCDAD